MEIDSVFKELQKIDTTKYQYITIDKDSSQIKVTKPWFGRALYLIGFRTNMTSDINDWLKNNIQQQSSEIKIKIKDEKKIGKIVVENAFTLVKTIKKITSISNELMISQKDLLEIKKTKYELLKLLLSKNEMPSLKELTEFINFNSEPVTEDEKIVMDFYYSKLPHFNKAKVGYELIEKKTRSLGLDEFTPQTIQIGKTKVQYYDAGQSDYQFIIHSVDVEKAPSLFLNIFQKKTLGTPSLCTSLVSSKTSFYSDKSTVAFVLAVDPKNIISTFRKDIMTPSYNPVSEGPLAKKMAEDFYNFYEKLGLITAYINHVYLSSGLDKTPRDDFQRNIQLNVLKELLDQKRKYPRKWTLKDEEMLTEINTKRVELEKNYPADYFEQDFPEFQLNQLIKHYENNPHLNNSQEFKKLFGREGKGIVDEIKVCLEIIQNFKSNAVIKKNDSNEYLYRKNFNKIQGPSELLSQTYAMGLKTPLGTTTYNEINVRLDNEQNRKTRPLEVKALMFQEDLFELLVAKQDVALQELVILAQANNIPIIIREF